ncbi:hypothetical protein Taro_027481 [Colocasia esculenta]|uniref:Uncharacterized protein n=1 Tax=Colocasia esculenta TaxID=4460 RepID=A0A843VK81_COLES|nr:hypothetical protein [Colocasia esculenta]
MGYVAFLKATYPLSPSGLMDGDVVYVAFLKATWPMSPSHRVAPDACFPRFGEVPGRRVSGTPDWPEGDTPCVATCLVRRHPLCRHLTGKATSLYVAFLKATGPMSPSQSRGRLCFRRFRFRFAVPWHLCEFPSTADSGAEGKTVVRTVACESLAELSWLVWDAEDNLEFYPVSLPSSGRARVGRRRRGDACYSPSGSPWSVGGDRENRVLGVGRGSGSRVVTIGIRAWSDMACSGSKLQQRSQARQLVEQQDESDMPAQGQVQEEVSVEESDPGLKPGRPSPFPLSLAPLLSPSFSLALSELPAVLGCLPRVEATVLRRAAVQRSCLCRAVRGGDGQTDEKAPTGESSQQRQGARRAEETGQ